MRGVLGGVLGLTHNMHAIAVAVLYQQQQFVEHDKFHLEFDAVDDGLVCCLYVEVAHVLRDNEADVEEDDEDVDDDEVADDFALHVFADGEDRLEPAGGFPDIES
ncbi:hypothetical protein HG530_000606 [Fusarium avenaceum]|nr:hypothetical protein HG530_000606 [Fusarium avenaceum]